MALPSVVAIEKVANQNFSQPIDNIFTETQPKLRKNSNVAIKINLSCSRGYETGVTSDPRIVGALVSYLQKNYQPKSICLVESDSSGEYVDYLYRWLGYEKLAHELNISLVNLSKDELLPKKIDGLYFKEIETPLTLENCDFFISLAKLKRHATTSITCILKNQFGCLPKKKKIDYHPRINDVIVDANLMRKPDLSIVDGVISLDGYFGPSAGLPKTTGLLIGGLDPVAVDALSATILKLRPNRIEHLAKAGKKCLGNLNYAPKSRTCNSVPQLRRYLFLDYSIMKLYQNIKRVL